jgi:hypothetical protein
MNVKKELKDWEREFEMRNGRPPTNEDKIPLSDRYIAYKMVRANEKYRFFLFVLNDFARHNRYVHKCRKRRIS